MNLNELYNDVGKIEAFIESIFFEDYEDNYESEEELAEDLIEFEDGVIFLGKKYIIMSEYDCKLNYESIKREIIDDRKSDIDESIEMYINWEQWFVEQIAQDYQEYLENDYDYETDYVGNYLIFPKYLLNV